MHSATVQSTKIDSIIANVPRFIDIPFRRLSFLQRQQELVPATDLATSETAIITSIFETLLRKRLIN
jgi:hypothetical protein